MNLAELRARAAPLLERADRLALRDRLAAAAAGAVAVAVLLASTLVYMAVRGELHAQVDRSLLQRARSVRVFGPDVYPLPAPPALGGAGGYAQYISPSGAVLEATGAVRIPVSEAARAVAGGSERLVLESVRVGRTRVRVATVPFTPPRVALQVARPLDEVEAILGRLRWMLLLVGVAGIALAASLGTLVARMALAPVDRLTRAAEHVAATRDPSRSIASERSDELGRLAASFNTMLAALDDSLRAQRRLVADASHELRTPLTSLRTNIEVLSRAPELETVDRERLLADVVAQIDDLTALVGDLVDLARGDEPQILEDVRLDELVEHEVERARGNHPRVNFELASTSCTVRGVPARIARAISNLLDNAGKWSPDGSTVSVLVADGEVQVRDRGPGIDESDLPHIFERFYRAPDARSLPGSGLGLAIVKQTARSHGGDVTAANLDEGGALFRLRLPVG